jgi:hypothetical protein
MLSSSESWLQRYYVWRNTDEPLFYSSLSFLFRVSCEDFRLLAQKVEHDIYISTVTRI